ncbi:biliverdin-producing heme oxygenase [Aquabacterium sp. J223]|uniref:biliverdin-producing heme oxygenase n=1 Tax=Aquabacterium sp. J223 TaxID=2898431 RepID=UPI0021AD701B|nr:biliverdin-producing heme oxygenase [Aquabacterium sp. J223]UUX94334.1 biliverdin-producing heme oxygenase [Aquabacterium sp. J223]
MDQPLSLQRYGRVIAGFDWFLHHWESRLLQCLPARLHDWFRGRSRRSLAQRDLRCLAPAAPHGQPFHDPTASLVLTDIAAQFGSLYVMEGSALGGQVLARDLDQRLGLTIDRGSAYFHGFGTATGALWREFRERLEQEVGPRPADIAAACAAANATFDALTDAFRHVLDDAPYRA